jgi:hypothetical protein
VLAEAEKILGDVRNREDWAKALRGVDAVIHLAAYQDLLPHFSKFFEVNSVGTALLHELIVAGKLPVKKVVVASSQFVYGEGRYQCAEHGEVFPDGRDPQRLAAGIWEPICPRCHGSIKPLRVLRHGTEPVGEEYFAATLERAIDWRLKTLKLDEQTDAYRVVNSGGDGLSGLTVDRYADVLSVKVNCLGVWQRLPGWLKLLHERLGTKREVIEVEPTAAAGEGITPPALTAGMRPVKVREHGVRYEVNFATGHTPTSATGGGISVVFIG